MSTIGSTLFSYLGSPALNRVSRGGPTGNTYLPLSGLLHVCAHLYETGAILGRAEPGRLTELISMSFASGETSYCLAEVKYLLRRRLETSGRYAHSFYTFYLSGTMRDMDISFDIDGMKEAHNDIRHRAESGNFLEYAGTEGLLLGSQYPDLVEKMSGHRYGPQEDIIFKMTGGIVLLPEEDKMMSLREREQIVLKKVNEFMSLHPEPADNLEVDSNRICSKGKRTVTERSQLTEAYLDIETTGLSSANCYITVVGISICRNGDSDFIQLVGPDITAESILKALQGANVLYTYNGSRFDLPFIQNCLGINLVKTLTHIDLMYHCWRKKLYGGLKNVERQLGIGRHLTDVNGYEAVRLWWRYTNDYDEDALNILLEYNKEDVLNLQILKEKLL